MLTLIYAVSLLAARLREFRRRRNDLQHVPDDYDGNYAPQLRTAQRFALSLFLDASIGTFAAAHLLNSRSVEGAETDWEEWLSSTTTSSTAGKSCHRRCVAADRAKLLAATGAILSNLSNESWGNAFLKAFVDQDKFF